MLCPALQVEMATGDTGVFAFLNQQLGGSCRPRADEGSPPGASGAAAGRLTGPAGQGAGKQGGGGRGNAGASASRAAENRQALVGQADVVTAAQEAVRQLQATLSRNRGNKQIAAQVGAKLQRAQQQLVAAQGEHARLSKAINQKDDHKKWMKF